MKRLLYVVTFIVVILWASVAQASLMLSPTRIDMVVEDGDTLPPISITNKGSKAVQIEVYAEWGGS